MKILTAFQRLLWSYHLGNHCFLNLMFLFQLRQQEKILGSGRDSYVDHVVRSTRLVILVNLLIDCPHVILHMIPNEGIPSVIVHMIFFHHLTLDPIIFVASNPSYRLAMLKLLHRSLPQIFQRILPQPPKPSATHRDSLEIQATHKNTSIAEWVQYLLLKPR